MKDLGRKWKLECVGICSTRFRKKIKEG